MQNHYRGFTLVEMCVAMLASSILMIGVANVVADSQRAFGQAREKAFGDVVNDSSISQRVFNRFVRGATVRKCLVGVNGSSLEVYYCSNNSTLWECNSYANFYMSGTSLVLETGQLASGTFDYASDNAPSMFNLAKNVTSILFSQSGSTLRMELTLDNGSENLTITACASRQNE